MKIITSETKLPPYIRKIFNDKSLYIQAQHVPIKPANEIIFLPYLFWSRTPTQVAVFIKTSDDNFNDAYASMVKATERILSDCIARSTRTIIVSTDMSLKELNLAKKHEITILSMSEKGLKLYRND